MQLDPQSARTWLETLHGNSPGLIHVCASGHWTGLACTNIDQALAYIETMDRAEKASIYVRATTLATVPDSFTRGSETDALALPGLWGDIDIDGPGHKHDPNKYEGRPLVPDEAGALELIAESGLPEPTLWIHSGGGMYPWWLLDEPHVINGDLDHIRLLSEEWQQAIERAARARGWHYGTGVKDIARVLRVVGTVNRKVPDTPKMCRIVSGGGGHRYTLTDLHQATQAIKANLPAPTPPPLPPTRVISSPTSLPSTQIRAGDALEDEPWDSSLLLGGAGWAIHHTTSSAIYWTRPGKNPRDGYSATTGRDPAKDRLFVFSDEAGLPTQEPLTKFFVYTELHHGGDFRSARRTLQELGFGPPAPEPISKPDPWVFDEGAEGPVVTPVTWKRFEWDDLGNGERFSVRYQHRVRFTNHQQWLHWDGRKWQENADILVEELAGCLVRDLVRLEANFYSTELGEDEKDTEQGKFVKWAGKQGSDARVRAMVSRGRTQHQIQVHVNDFDTQPMLFNCHNGVLDLSTGGLLSHDYSRLIRRYSPVLFDPDAKAPLWEQFLSEVVPDVELRLFLQRMIGYSLTGHTGEQVLFCHVGAGANGKSTLKRVLSKLFGDYFLVLSPAVLLADRNGRAADDGKLAAIVSRRFLEASESGRGRRWDEEMVKRLTGDDLITARHMYQEDFTFEVTGKVHLFTNELPHVSITESMWRRLRVFPWEVSIPEEDRDRDLARKLEGELPGILNWALVGCLDWQRIGLAPPPKSLASTVQYRSDEDTLGEFMETCLVEARGNFEPSSTVYQAYRNWADRMGLKPMSSPALTRSLTERGLEYHRTKAARGFNDVRVTNPGPNWISGAHPWTGGDVNPN